jgi:cyclohexanecarboxyl-CoA dehydrogenase
MFSLSPELEQLRTVARQVGADLAADYVARDLADEFAPEMLKRLAEASLLGIDVPEEAGGQGAGSLAAGVVCEEVAYGDFSAAAYVSQSGLVGKLLVKHADPAVAAEWLPALMSGQTTAALGMTEPGMGSDLRGVRMRAERSGGDWVLSGEKSSVSLPASGILIILARAEDGLGLFAVSGNSAGISGQRIPDLGFHAQGRGVKIFDRVRIPASHRIGGAGVGLSQIMAALATSKVTLSLGAVGTARAALDEAVTWAKQRETFGQPIATRQGVAFPLAQHAIDIDAARMLCWRALDLADRGLPFRYEAAQAKAWVPKRMVDVCRTALLTVGHVGYSSEHPAQLRLRDTLGVEMGEGTEATQLILVCRELLGVTPG